MNLKRILSCLLMLTLILTSVVLFSGCDEKAPSTGGVTTVKVWSNAGATKETMTNMVNNYNNTTGKEKGIKIEYTVYGDDYKTLVDLAFQNDQAPEILKVNGSKEPYAEKGDIYPINDLPGGEEFLKDYGFTPLNGDDTFKGKSYFVPSEVTKTGLIYNKDLFKKAGLVDASGNPTLPETWEEVREYAKKITNEKDRVYGIALPLKFSGFYEFMVDIPFSASYKGSSVVDIDCNNLTYDYGNLKAPFEWLAKIKDDGSAFPGAENLDNDTARAQFAEGRVGMIISQSWDVGVLTTQFIADCDWDVAPIPLLTKGERNPTRELVSGIFCVSKSVENTDAEKVMEVYKLFHSKELQTKLYESGLSMPFRQEIIQNANTSDIIPQWASYGKIGGGYERRLRPNLKLEGDKVDEAPLKIWAKMSNADEIIQDVNKRYTDAFKSGVENGSINLDLYK